MTRVQILLSEDEDRRLEELSEARGESKSSLVRRALGLFFELEAEDRDPLLTLAAQAGRAGTRQAARHHDRLLAEAKRKRAAR
jgi:predicted transcriptional regulator